jgi:hypothetical protein
MIVTYRALATEHWPASTEPVWLAKNMCSLALKSAAFAEDNGLVALRCFLLAIAADCPNDPHADMTHFLSRIVR